MPENARGRGRIEARPHASGRHSAAVGQPGQSATLWGEDSRGSPVPASHRSGTGKVPHARRRQRLGRAAGRKGREHAWVAEKPPCRLRKSLTGRLPGANDPERRGFEFCRPGIARLGYIELVDRRGIIPEDIPNFLVRTIRRAKHQPIWIPGPNFPDDPWDLYHQMKPSMHGNELVWQHTPAQKPNTWRERRSVH